MKPAPEQPQGQLVIPTPSQASRFSRMAKAGKAMRLAPGLYAVGATLAPEQVARQHLNAIVARSWPSGVLCGRTALAGGQPIDGAVYVAHPDPPRRTPLRLPGYEIVPVVGPAPLPGDMGWPEGLSISGPARALVENVDLRGRPARFRAGTPTVEDKVDEHARTGGAGHVQRLLDQLDVIGGSFDPAAVTAVRNALRAVLGSFSGGAAPTSERLAARLAGTPFDAHRVDMVEQLAAVLDDRAPTPRSVVDPASRWEWLPFFEAYFSNFIEGTQFGVDEARDIALDGVVPADRPDDAHDVAATFRLAADRDDRIRVPTSGLELVDILRDRHRILMAARVDKRPGMLKTTPNYAGGYQFVVPELVEGTLRRGFESLDRLDDPFARAVAMMLLVTECHPFDDGNGRVARLAVNAELSVAGQVRVLIPIVYRNNYVAALSGVSRGAGRGESLVAVLDFAQRWVAAVDWTTFEGATATLTECNAYLDPGVADMNQQRLTLPPRF